MPVTINGTTGIAGVDGSAGTPAVQGTDTNTGVYFPTADTISASTGGTERMRIDSSGNVGIGVSPSVRLDVASGSAALATNFNSTNASGVYVRFQNSGTSIGDLGSGGNLFSGGTAGDFGLTSRSGNLVLGTASTERMRIDTSGNVGIGTTSAGFRLTVRPHVQITSPTYATLELLNDTGIQARFIADSANSPNTASIGTLSNHDFKLITNNTERMRIDTSGNVGIGTSSPGQKLDVSGNIRSSGADANVLANATTGAAALAAISNARYWRWITSNGDSALRLNDETAGLERMRIDSGGNLLIASTNSSPSSGTGIKLVQNSGVAPLISLVGSASTNSDSSYHVYSTGAGAYRFYVGYGGTIYATSATITALSDQRLKENVRDLDVGLAAINKLRPRKFDWKAGKGADTKGARGFVAQEFEQVFPDLIDTWKDPAPEGEEPYKSVRPDLIPVLVKAIQELSAKNDELALRIATLEAA